MNIYDIESKYFTLRLDEASGVINNYNNIGEELYNCISTVKPKLVEPGLYIRIVDNYVLRYNCFIKSININYFSCAKDVEYDSKFIPKNDLEHLSDDGKLINCTIQIGEETDNPSIVNKNHFIHVFSHEVEHAYRYFSILSQNNGNTLASIKKSNDLYNSAFKAKHETKYGNDVFGMLRRAVYLIDNDEVSAFVNQTYEEIRQKNYINRNNITNYFNEFRMYRENLVLKNIVDVFDELIKKENGRKVCNEFLEQTYGNRYTGSKAIKMFRQRLIAALDYRIDKFLKIVSKALIDFNRVNNNIQYEPDEMRLEELVRNLDLIF